MAYKTVYDIKKVGCNIGVGEDAFPVDGIESLSAERNEDQYTTHVAADGTARNVRNNNRTGTLTVVVHQNSAAHDLIWALDKAGIQFPVAFVDKTSDGAVAFGDGCLLMRQPAWAREKDETTVEYVFTCTDLEVKHAGAADE